MTAYNREKYVAEAIESVLASTYTNLELIIVDDCSKDRTVEIARSYEARDRRVKVYVNVENVGDYPNRNVSASYASGKYLKYVDADDLIYPWGLELMVSMMERFPEATWGLCSLFPNKEKTFPFDLSPKQAYEYHYLNHGLFHKAPLSSIVKRDVFHLLGGFKNIRMAGDFEMWHRLGQTNRVVLMPDGMVWYREHLSQEMNDFGKYRFTYLSITIAFLLHKSCPLPLPCRLKLIASERAILIRQITKDAIRLKFSAVAEAVTFLFQTDWKGRIY